jgi:hypothetical protein
MGTASLAVLRDSCKLRSEFTNCCIRQLRTQAHLSDDCEISTYSFKSGLLTDGKEVYDEGCSYSDAILGRVDSVKVVLTAQTGAEQLEATQ